MSIRTQFTVTMVFFATVLVVVSVSDIITDRWANEAAAQAGIADRIALGAGELSYLANDYLIFRESQQLTRWQTRYASFSSDVAALRVRQLDQKALVRNIEANQERFTEVLDSTAAAQGRPFDPASLQVSWSRIEIQGQALASDASRLSQSLRGDVERMRRTNLNITLAMVSVFGAFFLANYLIVSRGLLKALSRLREGIAVIGSGDLGFQVEVEAKSRNEVGELSRAVNAMATDLRAITASKADLEREIADRKRAEEALDQHRTEFLGMISHELKNALTVVKGSAGLALSPRRRRTPDEMQDLFRTVDAQASRMRDLLDNLTDLTRIEAGTFSIKPEPVQVAGAVQEAAHLLARAGEARDVQVVLPEDLPLISADERRLEQVLMNLLLNASKFSPEHSPITVSVEADGEFARVTVRDQGRGLTDNQVSQLFRKFSQVHEDARHKGTGLGLVICKGIVEAHGGRIWAESAGPGNGANFSFTIPFATACATSAPQP